MTRSLHLRFGMAVVVAWSVWLGGNGKASAQESPKLPAAAPTLAAMVPAGVTQGATVEVTLQGTNLAAVAGLRLGGTGVSAELVPPAPNARPNNQQFVIKLSAAADAEPGMRELRVVTDAGVSNIVRFVVGVLPEATEVEPNDTPGAAMKLGSLPLVVNGSISRGEDRDHYRFFAKAGQQLILDLWGERLHPYVSNQRPGWFEGLLTVREAGKLGEAADLLLIAEKTVAEQGVAAKRATAAVTPAQNAARKANDDRAAAERASQAAIAAATKAQTELATATTMQDKLTAEIAAAEKSVTEKTEAAKRATEKATTEQAAASQIAEELTAAQKAAAQRAEAARVAAARAAELVQAIESLGIQAEKLATEKLALEKAEAAKVAADALASARLALQNAATEQQDTLRAAADAALAAADKAQAEKSEAERLAAEALLVWNVAQRKLEPATAAVQQTAADVAKASELVAQRTPVAKQAADIAAKAKQAAEEAARALQVSEKLLRDQTAGRKNAAEQLAAKRAAADRTAAERSKTESVVLEKKTAADKANAGLEAVQAAAKTATDELAAANRLVTQRKDAVNQLAAMPARNLAYAHDLAGREDPLLVFTAPKDGEYIVEVRDDLYRGRAEFNYRLTLGELPYVTGVFPAGGQRGTTVPVRLEGFGLGESAKTAIALAADAAVGSRHAARVAGPRGVTNDFQLEVGDDPEVNETEPNDAAGQAAAVAIPSVVNGLLERDGDVDVFSFTAKKGEHVLFEIAARSLGSPLDSRLELVDANGRRLKENDDNNNQADSLIDHTFTADGQYAIRVLDATDTGSRRHVYRLKLRAPRPDFSLLVSPDNPRVAAGGTVAFKVMARRRDGFDGPIELSVPNPPPGVTISPAVMAGALSEQMLTVTLAPDAASGVLSLAVVGKSKVGEQELSRTAVPAEAMRYVNDWRYVPVNDLILSVVPAAPFTLAWSATETKVEAGQTAQVTLKVTRAPGFTAPVRILLEGLPPRVSSPPVTIGENGTEAMVELRTANGATAAVSNVVASGSVTADGRSFTQATPAMRLQLDAAPKK